MINSKNKNTKTGVYLNCIDLEIKNQLSFIMEWWHISLECNNLILWENYVEQNSYEFCAENSAVIILPLRLMGFTFCPFILFCPTKFFFSSLVSRLGFLRGGRFISSTIWPAFFFFASLLHSLKSNFSVKLTDSPDSTCKCWKNSL